MKLKYTYKYLILFLAFIFVYSCSGDDSSNNPPPVSDETKELTIFHINDQHGRIENFSKIKHIVDNEKENTNVILACSGDIFSGNPVVDNHEEKGFPMIDLMNKVGFDISVVGNHEFDYGELILKDRFNQSSFDWVCANVNMNSSGIPEPFEYKTVTKNNIKVTFLGLVETNGKENATIPSTHPWRVKNLTFQNYNDVVNNYSLVKDEENSDLYIALTHLGYSSDQNLANKFPYFDLIIGGHSHSINNEEVNNIPIFQAGSNLNYLGKIKLTVKNKQILTYSYELINLENYNETDDQIKTLVDNYNENANLGEVIGFSEAFHPKSGVGSFYTDALRQEMNVDFCIQNTGGVRNTLDQGDITKHEIFTIDPFNNGSVIYTMKVNDVKKFLTESRIAIYYSGIEITQDSEYIFISKDGVELSDNTTLTLGVNDYIPAVYDSYFTDTPNIQTYTTAETLIKYLESNSAPINYSQVNNYFRYQ